MPRFRKKPVVIEAIQWTGYNGKEILEFVGIGNINFYYADDSIIELWNDLEECWVRCPQNHWVIKGIEGEVYPCEPNVMDKTYEQISD